METQPEKTKRIIEDFEAFNQDHIALVRYLVRRLNGPYERDREDLVQEVFLKAWVAIQKGSLRNLQNTPAWMGVLTSRTICTFLRKQEVRKKYHEEWNEEVSLSWEAPFGVQGLIFDGEVEAVANAFEQLNAKDQEVLRRFLVNGVVKKGHEQEFAGDRTAPTHDNVRWAKERIRRYYQREA